MSANDSRDRFEKWAVTAGLDLEPDYEIPDQYRYGSTDAAWCAWQAALSAQAPSVAVSELEKLADKWEGYSRQRDNDYEAGIEHGKERCADQLRNLIKANSHE